MKNKNTWSSRFGFILAATGAAVGLGPIWQFPYKVGANGGSAFVGIFIISLIFIGVPALIAEMSLGKIAKTNAVDSLIYLSDKYKNSKLWGILGWLGAITLCLILSFYSVVAGWSIAYLIKSLKGNIATSSALAISDWNSFLGNACSLLIYHSAFMLTTILLVKKDVNRGIEKASKIMMPALFIILLLICIQSILCADSATAINYLFKFDWKAVNTKVVIDALGQALFILAVGAGCMLVYGSYCDSKINIYRNSLIIALLTTFVAFVSGMAIFPLVFSYGIEPQGGPGLMFIALPQAFAQMQFGGVIAASFFLLLIFAAVTSSISLAEPLVVLIIDKLKLTRTKACVTVGVITWIIGILCLLSFNHLKNFKIIGSYNIFDFVTTLAVEILLPLGCLGFTYFAATKIPNEKLRVATNLTGKTFVVWKMLITYIVPISILLILLFNLISILG